MANEIPSVYIQVIADTGEVQRNLSRAEKAFLGYQQRTKRTASFTQKITKDFAKMAGGIFAVERAMAGLTAIAKTMFRDVSDFQTMSVELKVATGSALMAEDAFSMLQSTAKLLPTSLKDLTTGFVRLKNMGLDATQGSLISFSNTAAAMGKSLKQFVEAVADANTREFERLKEFGILARNEGEKIKFVFRGVTTEVDNSSADIVGFLTDIGNTEFAGAATEQINTLSSRLTKLKDSIFNLNIAFGEDAAGALGDFMKWLSDQADVTAFNKGLYDLNAQMVKTVKMTKGLNPNAMLGGDDTHKVRKNAMEIFNIFRNLTSKEFPAAIHLLEQQKDKMSRIKNKSSELYKGERDRLAFMWRGFKLAEAALKAAKEHAKAEAAKTAETAKGVRMDQQRLQINENFNEKAFQLRLRAANKQENIVALAGLELEAREKLVPINQNLARAADDEVFSAAQLEGFLRNHATHSKQVLDIQTSIAEFSQAEVETAMELAKEQADARKKRMEDLQKQMQVALELGNHADYNAAREKSRNLESRVNTLDGINLTNALKEKYDEIAGSIAEIRGKLAEGGLGSVEIIEANDALDKFTTDLDATSKALEDQKKDMTDWAKAMAELFDDVKEGIADAIVEGEGFKGVLTSILKQIAKTQILGAIGGFGTAGKAGTGFLGMLGGKPKGAFTGGPVSSGVTRLVGERGPELFTPSGAGMITPAHRVSGGGGSTVTVVNNFSIDGGDKQEMQGMIAQSVSASVSLAVAKMADNKRRSS
jgi:hypothetical protein